MAAPSKAAVVLKAVKRIAVQFSPFEANVRSTRYESLFLIVCVLLLLFCFFCVRDTNPSGEVDVLSRCCVTIGKLSTVLWPNTINHELRRFCR